MNKLALTVLAASLAGTAALWHSAEGIEERQAQAGFDRVAEGVMGNVSDRVARYQSVVQAGRAYVGGLNSPVTMAQWQAFVRGLSVSTEYPGLDGLVYIRAVPAASLAGYQQDLSRELGRTVTVNAQGARNGYCPITYVAPAEHASDWTGVDLCSIPPAQAALMTAMQTGAVVLTGPVRADGQGEARVGFYAPVYQTGTDAGDSGTRGTIQGWVGAPVRFGGMMAGLLSGTPGLDVQIFDGAKTDADHLLYDAGGTWKAGGGTYDGRLTSTTTLSMGGRSWTLVFNEPKVESTTPRSLALAGLLCSLLLYFIVVRAGRTRVEAIKLARSMTAELRDTSARLESITFNVSEGIYRASAKGIIEFANPSLAHLLGYDTADQLVNAKVALPYDDNEVKAAHGRLLIANRRFKDQEAILKRKDGRTFYALLSQVAVYDAKGATVALDGAVLDITERKQQEKAIHNLAYFDTLTTLPNRYLLKDRLRLALQQAARRNQRMAVMFIDMDRFKIVNDTLGHNVGDELLKHVAKRLSAAVRSTDTVARIGGDEFVVLLPEISAPEDAANVAQKLVASAGQPYKLLGHDVHSTPSVGIAIYPEDGKDDEQIMKHADVAMYAAKNLGRNNYQFYTAEMTASTKEKMTMESALHHALDRDELRVQYSARASLITGDIVGVEAMVAWQHPERGLLPASTVMPLAIQSGQIIPIGEWLAAQAFNDVKGWMRDGLSVPSLSLPLTEPQLLRSQVTQMLGNILVAATIPGDVLSFEISESTIRRDKLKVLEQLSELRKLGVRIALTDFGVSPDCVQLLADSQFCEVIISSAYVRDVQFNKAHAALVHALYSMGRELKLGVVTKDVENRHQAKVLKDLGGDIVQGLVYAPPMTALEFKARLVKKAVLAKTGTRK